MADHSAYGFTITANVSEKTSVFLTPPKTGKSQVTSALPFVLQSEWGVSTMQHSSLSPLT
ncbi:hypothetical protein SB521682_1323 [Shigella boydii 5216-82]|nr:hypothetical protein SB521682_1323 [Shigella boydii 5216-82]